MKPVTRNPAPMVTKPIELIASSKEKNMASSAVPRNSSGTLLASQPAISKLALATALALFYVSTPARADSADAMMRDPNAPGLVRGNSNLATPGLTDNLQSFGVAARVQRVEFAADKQNVAADGRSQIRVTVRLFDAADKKFTSDVPLLLETSRGRIVAVGQSNTAVGAAIDRDSTAVGTQVIAKQGEFSFDLVAPSEPGEALVKVSVGARQQTLKLNFLPDLREMIAVGLIEGVINLRDKKNGVSPVRPSDGFEQEIRRFAREFSDGKGAAGLRTAFFLKGKISGATLLTAAYDSDKDVRDRSFRDIQAEQFYPVYGDASLKGYDAATSGRLFVRVDNGKSYALYGDFNSAEQQFDNDAVQLSRYSRSLTGAKGHWQFERAAFTAFASRDSLHQFVDEQPGRGISGPYRVSFANGVQNSERVEVLVRDRNAPTIILRVLPQVRFVDYDFEPFSGRILFKSPVSSLDENLNPVSIRVAYEIEEGGPKYWVAGVEGRVKLGEFLTLGGNYAKDENPLAKYQLAGINATVKLGEHTQFLAELARSDRGDIVQFGSNSLLTSNAAIGNALTAGAAIGNAWRAEMRHRTEQLEARFYGQRADTTFANTGVSVASGRLEAGGKATYSFAPSVRVIGEVNYSKDLFTDGKRNGETITAAWDVWTNLTVEAGLRRAEQSGAGATLAASAFPGTGVDPISGGQTLVPNAGLSANLNHPYQSTSARLRTTYTPGSNSSVFVEGEQDLNNKSAHAVAVGGDYRFSELGRVYGRSENATGLSGSYGLAGTGRQSATVIGVDTQYMKDGQLFSEYRLRDALAGREAVAAVGLRNFWPVAEGVRLNTTLERVKLLNGTAPVSGASATPTATAAGVGVDYTANPLWKGSARVEVRDADGGKSWLSTVALARKLSDDWTLLARNYAYRQNLDKGDKNYQDRFQVGFAWRETSTNVWNALGKYEYRQELTRSGILNDVNGRVHVVSMDLDYRPTRALWYAGKVAGKWRDDALFGTTSKFDAQLLQGRMIYDITNRWDVGVIGSALGDHGFKNRRTGVGFEAGHIITNNLWLSVGYNFQDLKDRDLLTDYSSKGVFLKLRYKFDENVFARDQLPSGVERTVNP